MRIIDIGPQGKLPKSEKDALKKFEIQQKSFEMSVYIGVVLVVLLSSLAILFKWIVCAFVAGYLTPQTIRCFSKARQLNEIQKLIQEGLASVVGREEE